MAEKRGVIRFYNLDAEVPIRTLYCPQMPLMQADWLPSNSLKVGAVGGASWYLWDVSNSSQPYDSKADYGGVATGFSWCRSGDSVFSTLGANGQFKIHHYGHQKVCGHQKACAWPDQGNGTLKDSHMRRGPKACYDLSTLTTTVPVS